MTGAIIGKKGCSLQSGLIPESCDWNDGLVCCLKRCWDQLCFAVLAWQEHMLIIAIASLHPALNKQNYQMQDFR